MYNMNDTDQAVYKSKYQIINMHILDFMYLVYGIAYLSGLSSKPP